MIHKSFIQHAIKHPGSLRKALGVKKGQKIPQKELVAATKKNGKIGERARFALELERFHPNGH